jgi:hypothetical protein
MNNPKFTIHNSADAQFYFTLQAENGQVLVTSETYTTKQSCKDGIQSTIVNTIDSVFGANGSLKSVQKNIKIKLEEILFAMAAIDDLTL